MIPENDQNYYKTKLEFLINMYVQNKTQELLENEQKVMAFLTECKNKFPNLEPMTGLIEIIYTGIKNFGGIKNARSV